MKKHTRSLFLVFVIAAVVIASPSYAVYDSGQQSGSRDDTVSPHFNYQFSQSETAPQSSNSSSLWNQQGPGYLYYGGIQTSDCDGIGIGNPQPFYSYNSGSDVLSPSPIIDDSYSSLDLITQSRFGSAISLPLGSTDLSSGWSSQWPGLNVEYDTDAKLPLLANMPTIGGLFRFSRFDDRLSLQTMVEPYLIGAFPVSGGGVGVLPGPDVEKSQRGHDADPVKTIGGGDGTNQLELDWSFYLWSQRSEGGLVSVDPSTLDLSAGSSAVFDAVVPTYRSYYIEAPYGSLDAELSRYVTQQFGIGDVQYSMVVIPVTDAGDGTPPQLANLPALGFQSFANWCRGKKTPTDPYYVSSARSGSGSWGQNTDDQWAIKRVGFTTRADSAWNQVGNNPSPAVVAIIDTGLDWHHLDFDWANLWNNDDEIPNNDIDDDNNGYVDDMIGWDFLGSHNRPWDFDGHGTLVTGVIAASQNDVGIAGINPHARIMVLKAVNNFGRTRASYIAEAITYAVDNGAQVVNISLGGPHRAPIEQAALKYAADNNVLVVIASGNEGIELDDYGPAGDENALTVGATFTDDRAAAFSNYGDSVDLVAPGTDVLSLRARYTDSVYDLDNPDYEIGKNYVGDDKRYLHSNGTSFSAPIVTGAASLLWSKDPSLTADQVKQMLKMSAEDVDFPGKDQYSGYGMLDARALMEISPEFFVTAEIDSVQYVDGRIVVTGTADADDFDRAWVEIGAGDTPSRWRAAGQKIKFPVRNGQVSTISVSDFAGAELWQIQLSVEHDNGIVRSAVLPINVN